MYIRRMAEGIAPNCAAMSRILIADPCEVIRLGVRYVVEARPDREVVAEAADGKEAILQATGCKPDVVILEYFLPVVDGIEVTDYVRKRLPGTEILIFTTLEIDALLSRALAAGARGFLLKSDPNRYLDEAINSLAAHRPFFSDRISETLLRSYLAAHRRSKRALNQSEIECGSASEARKDPRPVGAHRGSH
jgi:DNA-binding NarL/FixJ family response regulator